MNIRSVSSADIYYTSGTGNTFTLCKAIREVCESRGIATALHSIDSSFFNTESFSSSLIGICMPTHGFTLPWSMLKFLFKIPRGNNVPAFVIAGRGSLRFGRFQLPGISGSATFIAALVLSSKGYDVRGFHSIDTPSNWVSLHSAQRSQKTDSIMNRANAKAQSFIHKVLAGKRVYATWTNVYEVVWTLLLSWISFFYLIMGRFFLAKFFIANKNCNQCGICIAHCPHNALVMKDGYPHWKYTCESCMSCMAFCPNKAIEASHFIAALTLWAAFGLPAGLTLGYLYGFIGNVPSYVDFAFGLLYSYAVLFLASSIVTIAAKSSYLRRVLSALTFTRFYRRYHASGFHPVKQRNTTV